ncbi:Homeodomain-like DNA binding domain-containing transcription factor [Phycomyces blakesleeanus NRRL 1555(-)]|uniref:Homeodomain-like DNA binding domain-containing transcription factor n=1 Tax=Phycomyces blakesleeanus (strain ATCC 8743b / DSM 1359 / FGSC 10004 / NBRC 33097 / NRRL 1555) TaxID=763407 RepID=A0A167RB76_PHYB8|nr:Homeodomain-like DNA binding domain-containing transcription factor [Phycomyces blakesleeanus NRRL 1555(-)]OAD81268.1 Homeodomain-like DNA binding domain-containing transcription factor [Phycomyces blakesleeanus NRRL 1555(-)]|eukprot:XP_018299308.1 Homeodomain-like DNA binding domain-containing transcription factor [Phycomyces blakesleeanus NRRL 1555(-)]
MSSRNKRTRSPSKRCELSEFEHGGIIWLYKTKNTPTEIANHIGIPRATINITIKRWEETGTTKPKTRPGRPKKLSVTDVTSLCLSVRCNPFESYAYHQRNMAAAGVIICRDTVIQYLKAKGFGSYTPVSKSNLICEQKKNRLCWVKARASFGIEDWSRVWKNRWEIKCFDYWPSQSPDLNPIERVWHALKANVEELKACILQKWERLDPGLLCTLVASMLDRVQAVIKACVYLRLEIKESDCYLFGTSVDLPYNIRNRSGQRQGQRKQREKYR